MPRLSDLDSDYRVSGRVSESARVSKRVQESARVPERVSERVRERAWVPEIVSKSARVQNREDLSYLYKKFFFKISNCFCHGYKNCM